jgi:hypothetical protein
LQTFLRSQLDLFYHLLVLEYGYNALFDEQKIARGFFQNPEQKDRITRLVDTLCYLCDHNQSFLVQACGSEEVSRYSRVEVIGCVCFILFFLVIVLVLAY